jgi:putative CocE/NonD family hydrolase
MNATMRLLQGNAVSAGRGLEPSRQAGRGALLRIAYGVLVHVARRTLAPFAHRAGLLVALLLLPLLASALDFGFEPSRDPDDVTAVDVMRDLAQRIVPVFQAADTDEYFAELTALQIVSGAYPAAFDSSQLLRRRLQGKPTDLLLERAVTDGIYARARTIESRDRVDFATAFRQAFEELVTPLDDSLAAAVMARLEIPPPVFREPVREAFDRWRGKGSLPQADALALVRTWLAYESRRSYAVLLPDLLAAERRRRELAAAELRRLQSPPPVEGPRPYVADAQVRIPVGNGIVIHARVVRPDDPKGDVKGPLPALLRFTLDPAEDDAPRSAAKGYVGVTAYVRGRTVDGTGEALPFVHDADDAAAVIEWIARQPWSDGRVGMLGDGYSGYAAWAAARRKPAALKAIATTAPMAPGIDFPMGGQIVRNAVVRWAHTYAAAGGAPGDTVGDAKAEPDDKWRALNEQWYREGSAYWDIDLMLGERSALVRTWLTHPSFDRYWQALLPTADEFARIDIPVLVIAGYYGADAGALWFHGEHVRHRPNADTTLLAGPWDAASIRLGTAPTLRGLAIDPVARVDLPELRYQWFDHLFRQADKPALLRERVNLQVTGADRWRHEPALDAPERAPLRLHLDTRNGEGPHRLLASPTPPDGDGQARISVDLVDRDDLDVAWPDTALRTRRLPTRNVIRFVSDPLREDTEVAGSLRGTFEITPNRQDVDLNVSLYEQTAGGDVVLLFEPYDFRASYAGHRDQRRLLRAGERQMLPFTAERLTARKLARGSRVVLVVGVNKRPDRQINYGSGKAVNAETIEDIEWPLRVRFHARSVVEMPTGAP